MILETCRRNMHVNRTEPRQHTDQHGNVHLEEWHVCRFCKRERKHRTVNVQSQFDSIRTRRSRA